MPGRLRAEASFWLLLALLALTMPLNWVLSALTAAAVHETGHLMLLRIFSVPVYGLRLRAGAAVMDTGPMEPGTELLCALAGPAASFLLLFLLRSCPRLSLCALVQGAFNLLPFGELDGARAARCSFCLMTGKSPCKRGKIRVQ